MVTEPEESNKVSKRERTDSNAGNSDSDLSESWNIVDLDTNNQDFHSSDGESIEVIDADDESIEKAGEPETDGEILRETCQLVSQPECPAALIEEQKQCVLQNVRQTLVREEMLETSFCWFLLVAVSAVLVSNLAFMAAENIFDWNADKNIGSPSFLQDLPVAAKATQQGSIPNVIKWTESEDMEVESVDNTLAGETIVEKHGRKHKREVIEDYKYRYTSHFAEKHDSNSANQNEPPLIHETYNILKYLNNMTLAAETHTKFDSIFLVLHALQIGLNDLEEVIAETPELHKILNQQRRKVDKTLTEIQLRVSRTLEKLASNMLDKVQNLERKFETQWCNLEQNWYGDSLKGFFYECEDSNSAKVHKKAKQSKYKDLKKKEIFPTVSVDHEIVKDNTGKAYSKSSNKKETNLEYSKEVSNENNSNEERDVFEKGTNEKHVKHKNKNHKQFIKTFEGKDEVYKRKYKHSASDKLNNNNESTLDKKSKKQNEKNLTCKNQNCKHYTKTFKGKNDMYERKNKHNESNKSNNNNNESTSDKKMEGKKSGSRKEKCFRDHSKNSKTICHRKQDNVYKNEMEQDVYAEDIIRQYLEDNCKKRFKSEDHHTNCFNKLTKQFAAVNKRTYKEMFNSIYDEYFKSKDGNIKWNKRIVAEDYENSEHKIKNYPKESRNKPPVIEDESLKNIFEINIVETSAADNSERVSDKVLLTTNQPKPWTLSYKKPALSNNSKLNEDWFIKVGEFRTKTRWLEHRSDWLFDRASQRRSHSKPAEFIHNKNWFFRRAWARQNCLSGTASPWC